MSERFLNTRMSDMRLNCAVIRGEINNSRKGTVALKLWLVGVENPLEIQLDGDCLRDLAGTHFTFNHTPIEQPKRLEVDLSGITSGQVGEITASCRLCIHRPNGSGGYNKPELVNVLRLEFFCEMGRVLLESFNFTSELINKTWSLSKESEFAQRACNFAEWQNHIAAAPKLDLSSDAQALATLYDEIHQRFANTFDFDQNEAALMGWTGILTALADEGESITPIGIESKQELDDKVKAELDDFLADDLLAEEQWEAELWDEEGNVHPLLYAIQGLIEDFELQAENRTFPRGRHYQKLINTLDDIEEGLRGLLNPALSSEMPASICLIGCREYLGKMMIAFEHFSKLLSITETPEGRRELLFLRDGMLDLREGISALRFQMNNM